MKKIVLTQLFLLCFLFAFSQNKVVVEGIVLDGASEKEESLIGVSVYLKDRPGVGVTTNIEGKFSIKASVNDIIIFSYVGYEDYSYRVKKAEKSLKIKMNPSTTMLEEAVIVGMGSQRKVSVVGAISNLKVEDLKVPATNINNLLGGRVPGIISIQQSGEPGKNISEFWIRGIGTFGANKSALVLIDGLEGNLSDIDPADIESFSVLKDASATAVYGVRGANGVVLITTKRGKSQRLQITARANLAVSQLTKMPNYLRAYDYAVLANEACTLSDIDPIYSDMELDLIKYKLDPDLYPDVNWQKEVLHDTSLQHTYYLSARGGGSIASYFISLNSSFEDSAYKQSPNSKYNTNVGYSTYGYRSNLDVSVTKTTGVYFGVNGYIAVKDEPGMANTNRIWAAQANLTPLTIPTVFSNGALPAYGPDDNYSPYVMLNHTGTSVSRSFDSQVTLAISQDLAMLTPGLKLRLQGAYDSSTKFNETRHIMPNLYAAVGRGTNGELQLVKKVNSSAASYFSNSDFWRKYHFETTLNYDKTFNKIHRVGGLLYYYMSDAQSSGASTSMAAIPQRYQGLSGRLTYGFKDTYMIDLNFGYTGSENFKPGKQFGFFPSIALGWVPTNYNFIQKSMPWLTFFKIRGSYGTAGNDRISSTRFPYLTLINSQAGSGWGSNTGGITENVIGADNLGWEIAKKFDVGIDAKLFNDKFEFTVDYFNDVRSDIFQQRTQVPDYVGTITMPYGNVGSMKSYGADGNFSYSQNLAKDLTLTVRGNFTYSANKVNNWEQPYPKYPYQAYAGYPLSTIRGYVSLGLFKDELDVKNSPQQFGVVRPGDIKYKDINADGVITEDDKIPLSRSTFPRLMYGFGCELRWKNLSVSALFKGTGNTDIYHVGMGYDSGYFPFIGGKLGNVLDIVANPKNRWIPASYSGTKDTENPKAKFPRLSYGPNANNTQLSTFWRSNSRYLRLQELSFNYRINDVKFLSRIGLKSVDLQLIGYNLAVFSGIKEFDPEQADKNGRAYPIPRRYAFQVYLNF